jgi:NTE family protein
VKLASHRHVLLACLSVSLAGLSASLLVDSAHAGPGLTPLSPAATSSDQVPTDNGALPAARQPRLGLVLAGGGARGAAHVGVLKVLEELGIRPDVIAGTSMGAIVGGLYASGMSAAELEQQLESIDWERVFSDDPGRSSRTLRRKQLERDLLVKRRLGFNRGGIQVPIGALQGQQLDQVLKRILGQAVTVTDFDALPIPFRAVATDLATGEAVIMGSGSLVKALRASMSVPGVFTPVIDEDLLLVDGGVAMNVPVEVALAMGAERLIVVDLSSPLLNRDELDSVLRITQQLTGLLTRRNAQLSLAHMGPDDILITPALGNITALDFNRSLEAMASGEAAARESLAPLQALAASREPLEPLAPLARADAVRLQFIDVDNRSSLNDALLWSRIRVRPGDLLDRDLLERDLDGIFALDAFDAVRYDLVNDEVRGVGVRVTAERRRWGPNYLQFGIALESDFDAVNEFTLGMAYTRNSINRLGGDLRMTGNIGQLAGVQFDFYQPLDASAAWFVESGAAYQVRQRDLFEEDRRAVGTAEIRTSTARLAFGRNFDNRLQLRAEFERASDQVGLISGALDGLGANASGQLAMLGVAGLYDSLDNVNFPSEGALGELRLVTAVPELGADGRWQQLEFGGTSALSRGRWSILARGTLGMSWGAEVPFSRLYRSGGFGQISGLPPRSLVGSQSAVAAVSAYRRIGDLRFLPVYGGVSFEAGNAWDRRGDMALDDLLFSTAVFIGMDTLLGPLYLAWGRSDRGDASFYFYLGNPFEIGRR